MATTYQQLLEQKRALEQQQAALLKQLEEAGAAEKAGAVEKVKAIMAEHGLTIEDLQEPAKRGRKPGAKTSTAGSKVAAKYRDAATGNAWSGRGLQPKWLKAALAEGKKIEDFAV